VTDEEYAYRDLVSLEAKGKAPEGTRERLMTDPARWRNALQMIRLEMAAHQTQREADLEEFRLECLGMDDGATLYAARRAEFLRWKAGSRRFRASLEMRLAEVGAICKQSKRDNWQVEAVDEWKTRCRDLIATVGDLLAVSEDQTIPVELWDRLAAEYDALPRWMHHTEKHRTRELTAAD
jgi:hypothetical protein